MFGGNVVVHWNVIRIFKSGKANKKEIMLRQAKSYGQDKNFLSIYTFLAFFFKFLDFKLICNLFFFFILSIREGQKPWIRN